MDKLAIKLTDKARNELYAAGWTPDREVNTAQVKTDLEFWGYHWNEHAQVFLSSVLDLHPANAEFSFVDRKHDFIFDSEYLSRAEEEFGKTLCPVGYFRDLDAGMLLAEDGTAYWVIDGDWGYLAENSIEALNRILQGYFNLYNLSK